MRQPHQVEASSPFLSHETQVSRVTDAEAPYPQSQLPPSPRGSCAGFYSLLHMVRGSLSLRPIHSSQWPLKMPKWAETNKKPSLLKQGPNFLSLAFPGGSAVKNLLANARDTGLIPGSRRSPGEGNGYSLQCSCLGNPMDRGAWWATILGLTMSQARLRNQHFLSLFHCRHSYIMIIYIFLIIFSSDLT